MNPVFIIAIVAVVMIGMMVPSAFAQYMGNVGSAGETGSYTLEEALEIQKRKVTGWSEFPAPVSIERDYTFDPTGKDCMSQGFWVDKTKSCSFVAIITDDSTGGDCTKFGQWNDSTKTCSFDGNEGVWESNGILIMGDGITLDGQNVSHSGILEGVGLAIVNANNINIKNMKLTLFFKDIVILNSNNVSIIDSYTGFGNVGGEPTDSLIQNSSNIQILKSEIITPFRIFDSEHIHFVENNMLIQHLVNTKFIKYEKNTLGYMLFDLIENVIISDNVIQQSGNNMSLQLINNNKNFLITNNTFTSNIDIQGKSIILSHNKLQNLKFNYENVGEHIISNNIIDGNHFILDGNHNSIILKNSFTEPDSTVLRLLGSQNNLIVNNNFFQFVPPINLIDAINLQRPTNDMPTGNIFTNNYWSGYDSEDEGCFDENLDDFCDDALIFSYDYYEKWFFDNMGGLKIPDITNYSTQDVFFEKALTIPSDFSNDVQIVKTIPEPEPKILSLGIAQFVDQTKDPQHYIDRYNNEPAYKQWFDENYSQYSSIYQAVGLEEPIVEQTNEPEYVSEPEYAPEPIVEPSITCGVGTELLNGFCQGVGDLQRATYSNSKLNFSIDIPKIFRGEIYEGYYPNHVEILSVLGVGYYDDVNEIYDPNLSNEEKMNVMLVETMDAFNSPNEAGVTSSSISVTHQEIIEKKEFTLFDLDLDLIATYPDGTVTPMEYKTREIHSSYSNEAWILSMHDDIDARDTRNIYYVMLDSFKILDNNRLEYLENIVQQEILSKPTCGSGTESVNGVCEIIQTTETSEGGGCLIATATYGSELAPQVQQLRELRDNQLLQTESGTAFMGTFNDIYYSFSPIVADYERENPLFQEAVKLAITPMISTLSLMENANSESEVLSIGISVIMLNLGMYLGVPAIVIVGIRKNSKLNPT